MSKGKGYTGRSREHSLNRRGIKTAQEKPPIRYYPQKVPSGKKIVVVDIDGTIFDVSKRWAMAKEEAKTSTKNFWNLFMDTAKVKYDQPIPNTATFLKMLVRDKNVDIVYLSGRRTNLMRETKRIMKKAGFPTGIVVLREKGMPTKEFKSDYLKRLVEDNEVKAFITDEASELPLADELDIASFNVVRNQEWGADLRRKIMASAK